MNRTALFLLIVIALLLGVQVFESAQSVEYHKEVSLAASLASSSIRPFNTTVNETNNTAPTLQQQFSSVIYGSGNFAGYYLSVAAFPNNVKGYTPNMTGYGTSDNASIVLKSIEFYFQGAGNMTATIIVDNATVAVVQAAWHGSYFDNNISGTVPVTVKIESALTGLSFYDYFNITVMTAVQYIHYVSNIQNQGKLVEVYINGIEAMNAATYLFGAFIGVVIAFIEYYWLMSSPKKRHFKDKQGKIRGEPNARTR